MNTTSTSAHHRGSVRTFYTSSPLKASRAVVLWSLLLLLAGCSGKKGSSGSALRASIGQPSEVLLVLGDGVLGSDLQDSLEAMLTCNVPGLNQGEDYFRLSRIPTTMHKEQFERMHTKLLVKIDPKLAEPQLGTARNVAARPQLQVQVAGPSLDALRPYLSSHAEQIRQLLLDNQLSLLAANLQKHHSQKVAAEVKKLLGISLLAPEEIKFTKQGKAFLWGSSRSTEKQLNTVVYAVSLTDALKAAFQALDNGMPDSAVPFVHLRDSVMQQNIPGSLPDQWMETTWEDNHPMVLASKRDIDDRQVVEMRGLWQMRNGAMGGPFVQHILADSARQRLIVCEGFVYSPSTNKRDLIRQLEASLRTITIE